MKNQNNSSLSHVGVLGMKWGRRRGSSDSSSSSPDHQKAQSLKGKKLSDMSNDELRILTGRMQLEKQYKEARKQDTSSGKRFVAEILSQAGKQVAATYVAKFMGQGVDALIKAFKKG